MLRAAGSEGVAGAEGVAKGMPLGRVSLPPWAAETLRRPVSSMTGSVLTWPAQAPMPCDGRARLTPVERGETYLPGAKMAVTRSLNEGAMSMVSKWAGRAVFQSKG